MNKIAEEIYDPTFVCKLFDEMAETYGIVNLVSSFGFSARWRKQCVRQIKAHKGMSIVDLMTGMGELLPELARKSPLSSIRAIDLSPVMCQKARKLAINRRIMAIIDEVDALETPKEFETVDAVVSSFGLKTFSPNQRIQLAKNIHRMLKPGGQFSLVEISVPPSAFLRIPYMFYLKRIIPIVGRIFLGNPENYRMLGVYTQAFENCSSMIDELAKVGLVANPTSYFFGCATGVFGHKPHDFAICQLGESPKWHGDVLASRNDNPSVESRLLLFL